MTLTASDLTVGQKVRITDVRPASHCFGVGNEVEVRHLGHSDLTAVDENATVQYLDYDQIEVVSDDETALVAFQREVVAKALAAAKVHGWCSEVQRVLRDDLGLGHLLSTSRVVEITVRVNVEQQPGQSDGTVRRLAREAVTLDESKAWREAVTLLPVE